MCESAQSFTVRFLGHSKALIHSIPYYMMRVYINIIGIHFCISQTVAAMKFALSENRRQENSHAWQKIRISFLHSQQRRILSPDSLSYMASAAFPSDKGFWAQLLCLPCYERDQRVNTFCAQFFIKQDSHQRKLIFPLPSIVIESTSLDVVTQWLVDAETEHSQTWPSSRFRPLFSSFSIRIDEIIGYSFSTNHGKY